VNSFRALSILAKLALFLFIAAGRPAGGGVCPGVEADPAAGFHQRPSSAEKDRQEHEARNLATDIRTGLIGTANARVNVPQSAAGLSVKEKAEDKRP
jgi:hypothetical protein